MFLQLFWKYCEVLIYIWYWTVQLYRWLHAFGKGKPFRCDLNSDVWGTNLLSLGAIGGVHIFTGINTNWSSTLLADSNSEYNCDRGAWYNKPRGNIYNSGDVFDTTMLLLWAIMNIMSIKYMIHSCCCQKVHDLILMVHLLQCN